MGEIRMKTCLTAMLVVLAFCFGTAGAQELIRMDTYAFDSTRRPAAVFDHDIHNEAAELDDCAVCHHVWENGTLVEDESSEDSPCSECHGVNPTQENEMALANAFHTKCRSCHIDKGAGPILCGQCHRKMQGGE